MPAIYINRYALQNFWREYRPRLIREMKFWPVAILLAFLVLAAFFELSFYTAAKVDDSHETRAIWIGDKPTCPDGSLAAADQTEAMAGKDAAYCECKAKLKGESR
jgi:hypothetical protein